MASILALAARGKTTRRLASISALTGLVALVALAVPSPSWAADADGNTAYTAPAACPGVDVFRSEVAKRVGADRAIGSVVGRARTVIAGSDGAGYDGTLNLDGRMRSVHAATCDEVVQALALAAALAAEEIVADPPEAPPEPPATAVPSVAPSPPPVVVDRRAAPPTSPSTQSAFFVGAGLGATGAVGPTVAPELFVFGGLDIDGRSVRLALDVARSSDMSTPVGTARFERWSVRADGCPLSVRFGVRLSPCVRFDGGVLRGVGESITNAESSSFAWLAVGVGAKVELDLGRTLFLAGDIQAGFPLLRHGFFVRPNDIVFEVPAVFGEAALSLGYRFSK